MLFAGGKNMFKVNNKSILNYWTINVLNLFLVHLFHATGRFMYSLFSEGTERDKWYEIGNNEKTKLETTAMLSSRFQWEFGTYSAH